MRRLRPAIRGESGITLVEVIVTMGLMVLIITITASSVVNAMQAQRRQVERVGALNNAKIAMERVTRELRSANPLGSDPQADSLTVTVIRDGVTKQTTYALAAVDDEVQLQLTEVIDGTAHDPRPLLRRVELDPGEALFRYFDHDGEELDPDDAPVNSLLVRTIEVRLSVGLRESDSPVALTTVVLLRNAEAPE